MSKQKPTVVLALALSKYINKTDCGYYYYYFVLFEG